MSRMKWMVLLGVVATLTLTGCQTMRDVARACGFESRGARQARELREQKSELETRLVAMDADQQRLQAELDAAIKRAHDLELAAKANTPAATKDNASLADLGSKGTIGIKLEGDILFEPGKTVVRSGAKSLLGKVATKVKASSTGTVLYIDGHTDSDPLKVTKALYHDNYGLGAARAEAVARELVALGVPRTKLVTRSFGPDYPVADNKSTTGKKQNRRVEISFASATGATDTGSQVSSK